MGVYVVREFAESAESLDEKKIKSQNECPLPMSINRVTC